MRNRLGHVFTLATQNCFCVDPRTHCNVFGRFSALQFLPPAPEALAEIRTTILYVAFCPHHYPIRAFTQCHLKYFLV